MGYAAGRCPRFRPGEGEAVRFSVAEAEGVYSVRWLVEAASLPVRSGETSAAALESGEPSSLSPSPVAAQLRAYWAAFRKASATDGVSHF